MSGPAIHPLPPLFATTRQELRTRRHAATTPPPVHTIRLASGDGWSDAASWSDAATAEAFGRIAVEQATYGAYDLRGVKNLATRAAAYARLALGEVTR